MVRQLRDLLSHVLPNDSDWKIQLFQSWDSIMGPLANKVRIEKIEEELLVLGVFDACWMQELYLLAPILLTNINKNLDRPRIKQLRFKRVGVHSYKKSQSAHLKKREPDIQQIITTREQYALNSISDDSLRNALLTFLQRCKREK